MTGDKAAVITWAADIPKKIFGLSEKPEEALEQNSKSVPSSELFPAKINGVLMDDVTSTVVNGKTLVIFQTAKSEKKFTDNLREEADKNKQDKVKVHTYNCETKSPKDIVVKATPFLPWYTEIVKQLSQAFMLAGAGGLAAALISLIIGTLLTPFMFIAGLVCIVIGSALYLVYTRVL